MNDRERIARKLIDDLLTNGGAEVGERLEIRRGLRELGGWGPSSLAKMIGAALEEAADLAAKSARADRDALVRRMMEHADTHDCRLRRRRVDALRPPL